MTGDKLPNAPDTYHASEHEEQTPNAPCAPAAPVPMMKPVAENFYEKVDPVANPNINLEQQPQATVEDPDQKGSSSDYDTVHAPVLSPPSKGSPICVDQSKSAANSNESVESECEAETQTPSNPQPSICPSSTPTDVAIETKTFVQTSDEPRIGSGREGDAETELNVHGPSGSTIQQKDYSHAKSKVQGTEPEIQPSHTTFMQQRASDSNNGNTEAANSDAQVEKFEQAISTPSEIELRITEITESECNSESSDESSGTTKSKGSSGQHSNGACSGAKNSNGSSNSSLKSGRSVHAPTGEPGTNEAMQTRVVYRAGGTPFGDVDKEFLSDSDSTKSARPSTKVGSLSTKEALVYKLKTLSRRNTIIVVRDRTKKLFQLVTKIASAVKEVLVKLSYSPLQMIKLIQALLRTDIASRVLVKFKWTSEDVSKIVVRIVEYVVRVLHSLRQLLLRRIIPGTQIVAAKTYCAATSLILFLM